MSSSPAQTRFFAATACLSLLFTVPVLAGLALGAAACGGTPMRPDGGTGMLPIGAKAPDLTGYGLDEKPVTLSTLSGKRAVVYFYPKDGTPGCTKEACAFRDAWSRYEQAGITVFGVSDDTRAQHKSFQAEHKLPFPLVADTDGVVGRGYGVKKGLFGYSRVTFLIGPDGKIEKVWPDVDPGVHASEVLATAGAGTGGT